MYKLMNHKFSIFLVSLLLFLGVLIGYQSVAQAKSSKPMKSFSLDPSGAMVNVATIYETPSSETQEDVIDALKSSKAIKKAPGFKSFSILQSEDGTRVMTLSQWQDLASYQTYTASPVAESKKLSKKESSDTTAIKPTKTLIFEIAKAQAIAEGITPSIRGKEAVVQFSDFSLKSPEDELTVQESIAKMMPEILQKQPAPQAVVLLKSVDNSDVALLANWNCSAAFEDVGKPTEFESSAEIASLAATDQHLYDVVKIIPAESTSGKWKGEKS